MKPFLITSALLFTSIAVTAQAKAPADKTPTQTPTTVITAQAQQAERNKKLVALVYADYEALDSLGLNNPDNLKTIMDENLKNLNNNVAAYEKVSKIQLYPTEFEKTPKRSIKRYLYNSIAVD